MVEGIELQSVNLNSETDMQEIFEALAVKGPGPKSRLRAYIQRLQPQQINFFFQNSCSE